MLPYTSSTDVPVKSAAFKALANLAGPDDQDKLIELLSATENQEYIADLQSALAAAASKSQIRKEDQQNCFRQCPAS